VKARRCQGCGAPLPVESASEAVECAFCGLRHERDNGAAHAHVVGLNIDPEHRRWISRLTLAVVLVCVVAAIGSIASVVTGLMEGWRAVESTAKPVLEAVATAVSKPARRTTADLKDLPWGHHALDVAPPPGGYASVDPLAALRWALPIAQAWETDARLERIDVSRLRPDGTINVQDDVDAELRFRFLSPSAVLRLRQQARVQADARGPVGFWVTVKGGQPSVFADQRPAQAVRGEEVPPYPQKALPLPTLFEQPAVRALASDLPFLKGYLISLERDGWVWYFSSLANESLPRVRATDGAVWPYRR
jgi:hypothetical protein